MPILGAVGEAVHALGYYFLDAIPEGPRDAEGKPRIVAIFAGMDNLTYCTTILALSRAGFRVRLKIYPRSDICHDINSCFLFIALSTVPSKLIACTCSSHVSNILSPFNRSNSISRPSSYISRNYHSRCSCRT